MPAPRLLSLLVAAALAAGTGAATTAAACTHDAPAGAPAVVAPTLGKLAFPTSTRSPEAQALFERGLLWWHLFEYQHAAADFQAAQALDPDFALAYWGEAMTYTHALWNQDEPEAARAVLARFGATPAERAARAGSDRERAWLDTAEQLFGDGTVAERDARFLAAAAKLAAAHPDDDEAQLLHGLALIGQSRGERKLEAYLEGAAIARRVLARNPDHPGAAHYWIHGMDDPAHAADALEAAHALARIAPDAGHAQHMASHIFSALGLWPELVAANEAALKVTDAETVAMGLPPFPCGHYVEWLQYGYYQQGRPQAAQRLLDACANDGAKAVAWHQAHPDRPYRSLKTPVALQQRWHESLATMRGMAVVDDAARRGANAMLAIDVADLGRSAAWDAFVRGYAAAEGGDLPAARKAQAALQAIAAQPAAPREFANMDAHIRVLDAMLAGAIAARSNEDDAALGKLAQAGTLYASLPFDYGPPVPMKPPFEAAGEQLLAMDRPVEAAAMFDRALQLAPRRAASLLGRARALAKAGDSVGALEAYAQLSANWADAEADLPALREVRDATQP